MKSLTCLPFCAVVLLFCLSAVTSQRTNCCLKTGNIQIHISRVKSYRIQTAGVCPIDAIVLLTIKGKELCYDPKSAWVQEVQTIVDQRKSQTKQNSDSTALGNQNAKTGKKKRNGRKGKGRGQKKQKGPK